MGWFKTTNMYNKEISAATNASNERMNQANIDYQRELNQQLFDREDTAYQRTVSDMINAGLSPSMMSSTDGSGGSVSAPANTFGATNIPSQQNDVAEILNATSGILNLWNQSAQVQNVKAQTNYINEQARHLNPAQRYLDYISTIASSTDPNSPQRKDLDRIMNYLGEFVTNNNLFSKLGVDVGSYVDKSKQALDNLPHSIEKLVTSGKEKLSAQGKAVLDSVNDVLGNVEMPSYQLPDSVNKIVESVQSGNNPIVETANKRAEKRAEKREQKELKKAGKKRAKELDKRVKQENKKRKADPKKVEQMQYKVR